MTRSSTQVNIRINCACAHEHRPRLFLLPLAATNTHTHSSSQTEECVKGNNPSTEMWGRYNRRARRSVEHWPKQGHPKSETSFKQCAWDSQHPYHYCPYCPIYNTTKLCERREKEEKKREDQLRGKLSWHFASKH